MPTTAAHSSVLTNHELQTEMTPLQIDRKVSDDSGFMPFMQAEMIRPIAKPSIGDRESVIEGTGESFMNGGMTLELSGVPLKMRYAQSDADLIRERTGSGRLIQRFESFEYISADCLNDT